MKMRMRIKVFVMLLVLFSFVSAKAEIIDRIIAKVDDKIITLYDLNKIRATIRAYPNALNDYRKLETIEEKDHFLLDLLIDDLLIEQEMEVHGITANENEVTNAITDLASQNGMQYDDFIKTVVNQGLPEKEYKVMIKKQIEKMKYYARFINSKITVTDKEILTYFRENMESFNNEQKIDFAHILFLKNGYDKKQLEMAKDFLKRYKETSSVEDAAEPFLEDESVKIVSDVSMKKTELASDFKEPLEKIKPGEATGIIENDSGYNIIVLKDEEVISLDSLRDKITRNIQTNKRDKVYKSMLSKLKQGHLIEKRY